MKLVSKGSFDKRQIALAEEIIRTIKLELEKVETPSHLVKQLSGDIAFSVASLLDDVAGFTDEAGEDVAPMVVFQTGEDELEYCGGNSWMHEYVYQLVPKVFGE